MVPPRYSCPPTPATVGPAAGPPPSDAPPGDAPPSSASPGGTSPGSASPGGASPGGASPGGAPIRSPDIARGRSVSGERGGASLRRSGLGQGAGAARAAGPA